MKGWENGWREFGKVLIPLTNRFPEVIALMRHLVGMVSTNHSGSPTLDPDNVSASDCKYGNSSASLNRSSEKSLLFVPLFSRAYCLGSCLKVAEELHRQSPKLSILILEPRGGVNSLPPYIEIISMSALRKKGFVKLPGAAISGVMLWKAICRALTKEKILCDEMTRVFGNWKRHLLKWCCLYHYDEKIARQLLVRRRVESVVTINDIVKPAAPIISAGNKLGIQTVVLQHGTPGPQSAPFIAREGWVWGETSKRAIEVFGADPSRLRVMGSLESEGVPSTEVSVRKSGEARTLVFLGQWRATRGWGEPFFQEVFDLLCEVIRLNGGHWKLRIRLHPTDPAEAAIDIASRLKDLGADSTLSSPETTMEEELASANALLSISSSGLMNGVSAGIPTAQILPEDLERKIGPALLSATNLLRDQAEFENWLQLIEAGDPSLLESNEQVLANRGEVARLMARNLI
ncbi:hypothetical protein N9830_02135 [Akkermansiaceae bacterium]|nr:hypothetical protein [Akkermansiaceae bacterium]MDB4286937.1 hypothetical protein [Akkermansiaceae bacterium]MDB4320420.1 hypothetical protein [Akkermansiaceae bacterium]MDB4596924.1 hypothetical protein [Akkermansiaceae bacterium]MDB4611073.1 hypothetical protein [Akkermansiaceae bacterium]